MQCLLTNPFPWAVDATLRSGTCNAPPQSDLTAAAASRARRSLALTTLRPPLVIVF
jgi:hypothetical protein